MIRKLFILSFILLSIKGWGQSLADEIAFLDYLYDNSQYEESIYLLHHLKSLGNPTAAQIDSIHYLIALNYYNMQLDSARKYFDLLKDPEHPLFVKSVKAKAFIDIKNMDFAASNEALGELKMEDSYCNCLKAYNTLADTYIVLGKKLGKDEFQNSKNGLKDCDEWIRKLDKVEAGFDELQKLSRKSAFSAGLLSALVPGAGRIYIGKPKQGLATITPVLVMGIQGYEAFRKNGTSDPRFIVFGSLFSIFYVGNIWGSVMSLHIKKMEVYEEIHHHFVSSLEQHTVWK